MAERRCACDLGEVIQEEKDSNGREASYQRTEGEAIRGRTTGMGERLITETKEDTGSHFEWTVIKRSGLGKIHLQLKTNLIPETSRVFINFL